MYSIAGKIALVVSVVFIFTLGVFLFVYFFGKSSGLKNSPQSSVLVSPSPYAGWKTYVDPKGRFSFKYPGELYPTSDSLEESVHFSLKNADKRSQSFSIGIFDNRQNKTIQEIYQGVLLQPTEFPTREKSEPKKIANYDALVSLSKGTCTFGCNAYAKYSNIYSIWFKGNGFVLKFTDQYYSSDDNGVEDANQAVWLSKITDTLKLN